MKILFVESPIEEKRYGKTGKGEQNIQDWYTPKKMLNPLITMQKVRLTIPEKPTSSKQKYVWSGDWFWLDHLTSASGGQMERLKNVYFEKAKEMKLLW